MARTYPFPVQPPTFVQDQLMRQWLQQLVHVEDVNFVASFTNGWGNDTGTDMDVGYYKDPWGRVYLQGRVSGGTSGTSAFTLPEGYRPAGTARFRVVDSGGAASVAVNLDGTVVVTVGGTPKEANLDSVQFRAAG